MRLDVQHLTAAVLFSFFLVVAVFAGPKIKVDNTDYDAGTILEGSKERVTHTFKLKNIGDEPLHIKEVKPG